MKAGAGMTNRGRVNEQAGWVNELLNDFNSTEERKFAGL